MALIVVGVSHTTAPIEVREKLTFRPQEATRCLSRLRADGLIREGVVLSTCNRTEFYAVEENGNALSEIESILSDRLGDDAARFIYVRHDRIRTDSQSDVPDRPARGFARARGDRNWERRCVSQLGSRSAGEENLRRSGWQESDDTWRR